MCDQQSLRSACAYAQSDQSLCKSLEYSMTVKLMTEYQLEFLSLKWDCTGSSESTHVKMSHCWKSHATAHLFNQSSPINGMKSSSTSIPLKTTLFFKHFPLYVLTVLPTKSDSDVIFCLQSLSKTLTCTLHLS